MRDQPAAAVDHEGLALVADLDLRHDLPDEFQVHLGDAHARVAPRACHRERHVGLRLAAEVDRAVVDFPSHGFGEFRVLGIVGADADRVHRQPRHPQLFLAAGVELRELGDRGNLPQQPQRVEAPLLQRARRPGELGGPADLAFDILDELPDLAGRGLRLFPLDPGQGLLVLLVGEPDFEQAVGEQRHADHGDEQRHVFAEQPAADMRSGAAQHPADQAGPGRCRRAGGVVYRHSLSLVAGSRAGCWIADRPEPAAPDKALENPTKLHDPLATTKGSRRLKH